MIYRRHTCAVLEDGFARCWGNNNSGQLGDGTTTDSNVPIVVSGLVDLAIISAGNNFTCAVVEDGTARCWGYGGQGQLGNSTYSNSLVPVTVTGLTDAVALTAGNNHACALLGDGTGRCWGINGFGQLGDGTTSGNANVPVPVTGLTDAVGIAAVSGQSSAADHHTCAVLADGTARCWGNNNHGQLGDGTTTDSIVPVVVTGLTDVVDITGGTHHTCALIEDGSRSTPCDSLPTTSRGSVIESSGC